MLTVHVSPRPYYRREGSNLLVDVPITPLEAALGTKIEVPTLSEGHVNVKVPPGHLQRQYRLLAPRQRRAQSQNARKRGDQYAVVKIVIPHETREAAQKLKRMRIGWNRGRNLRRNGLW